MVTTGLPLAAIMAHLSHEQIQLASWYFFDGIDQEKIGGWLGITQPAVAQRIATVLRTLNRLGIPVPKRMEHPDPQATRHIRTVNEDLARCL